jgi:hypothetical protein
LRRDLSGAAGRQGRARVRLQDDRFGELSRRY